MHFRLPLNIEFLSCRKVIGLHCAINSEKEPEFTSLILFRRNGVLEIENLHCFRCDFEKLHENIPPGLPIMLSIDGKGILHKKVNSDNTEEILKKVMPGGSKEDFIIDSFPGSGNEFYVSIARKDYVDGLIKKLSYPELYIIDLNVNPLRVALLTGIFDELPSFFKSGCYEIQTDGRGFIAGFSKHDTDKPSERIYTFNGNELDSQYLLPFCNAIKFFTEDKKDILPGSIEFQRSEFHSKRYFAYGGLSSLSLIFFILLMNFNLFTKLSEKKEQLDQTLISNKELLTKIEQLKEEISWKEKFLSRSGIIQNRLFSYLSDDIGASIPENISLEKLELHPVGSKIAPTKEIIFQPDILRVQGIAATSAALNNWIRELKKLNWTLDVIVENYLQPENSDAGAFTIEVTIDESLR